MKASVLDRPTRWWRETLERRAERPHADLDLSGPPPYPDEPQRSAAIKFFNAAYRAEQSGLAQAHQLARDVERWDPELARVLALYGDEEGWHRELLQDFLGYLGGQVQPMGRVTRLLFEAHGRARRMETIVLVNVMFETIGSTTYRMALRRATHPEIRKMLAILTRDEAFHVPLNVHFLRRVVERSTWAERRRLAWLHRGLFLVLLLLPLASRPKTRAFDGIPTLELVRAYARELAGLFLEQPALGLSPPWLVLRLLGIRRSDVRSSALSSVAAAERAARREDVAA